MPLFRKKVATSAHSRDCLEEKKHTSFIVFHFIGSFDTKSRTVVMFPLMTAARKSKNSVKINYTKRDTKYLQDSSSERRSVPYKKLQHLIKFSFSEQNGILSATSRMRSLVDLSFSSTHCNRVLSLTST